MSDNSQGGFSGTIARLVVYVIAGAVIGLVVGLILMVLDVVDNPFWLLSAGILAGAITFGVMTAMPRE